MADSPSLFRPQGEPGPPGHEPTDIGIRRIVNAATSLVIVCVGTLVLVGWIMRDFRSRERTIEASRPPSFSDDRGLFPEPRLQENPRAELLKMRQADAASLSNYGWIDRKSKIARIPIDRAMEVLAKQDQARTDADVKSAKEATPAADSKAPAKPGGEK